MERFRQRIIDALLSQKGLSVVERDLEFQEEILREQRLSGSVLADEMFRVELGKIQGGGVSLLWRSYRWRHTKSICLKDGNRRYRHYPC